MTAVIQQVPDSIAPANQGPNKAIFLFSDGTGNSSAKLFKTNVWRLYEMLDLGPAPKNTEVQIAYYDNGVGTSTFRPLALLGGVFGFGLKRNVLRLYTFLCRNYRAGDRIYAFGFSRGAFTIRLLAALVDKQGVLSQEDDANLAYLVHDAYREYCRDNFPPRWSKNFKIRKWIAGRLRSVRDVVIRTKRRWRDQAHYNTFKPERPEIEFVGVWDTVAAYGGPFAELTRGIDDWVWPLSLPNYTLPAKVKTARHALSLDDERDAFWPLIWDEKAEGKEKASGRLKQVWFSGVHSDVGGGYPDESLSFASLTWMMDELVAAGKRGKKSQYIRFIPQLSERTAAMANALGPIHNSRAGFAAYYRYQPRKITAFLVKYRQQTESMRDPQGIAFLDNVLVHESVLARIVSGVDNYAPAALPEDIGPVLAEGPYSRRLLSDAQLGDLERTQKERACRFETQENQWDAVWWRRATYFLTIGATSLLVALPSVAYLTSIDKLCGDDRCFASDVSRGLLFFLPDSFRGWLTPWAARPISTLFWVSIIVVLVWSGMRSERGFRDSVRKSWDDFRKGNLTSRPPPATKWRKWRESPTYQGALRRFKWSFLPLLFGWLSLLALAYAAIVVISQTLYVIAEPHGLFCSDQRKPDAMDLKVTCTRVGQPVERNQLYRVTILVDDDWMDDSIPADPVRGASKEDLAMILGRPLKRVTHANWLQPVTEVRADRAGIWHPLEWLVGKNIEMRRLRFVRAGEKTYATEELCPRRSGQLHVMANDAAPLLVPWFYRNNQGSANVTVTALGKACKPKSGRD